jgi:hypothetical protein
MLSDFVRLSDTLPSGGCQESCRMLPTRVVAKIEQLHSVVAASAKVGRSIAGLAQNGLSIGRRSPSTLVICSMIGKCAISISAAKNRKTSL